MNTFNRDISDVANVKTQHSQIMTTIRIRIFKFKPVIKKLIVVDNTFFTVITFSRINS